MSEIERYCDLCGLRPVHEDYREITGWEKLRAQGGANHITARRETGRLACSECITRMRRGLALNQEQLWP